MLLTPDTFIRAPLPGMKSCTAVVHAGPALGARFTQYTAEFEADGMLGDAVTQRFVYVLDGNIRVEAGGHTSELEQRGYAYFPQGLKHHVSAARQSRASVIEKIYEPLESREPPKLTISTEDDVPSTALEGDQNLQVRRLLGESPSFDFAVSTLTYQPGAALSMVEMHVMEHGLLMLEGGGIYRLGDSWYPVAAGDFIYMAPWCPQWFGAIGKVPAKYLLYKDWNRHPQGE